jgi:hypothetical protein
MGLITWTLKLLMRGMPRYIDLFDSHQITTVLGFNLKQAIILAFGRNSKNSVAVRAAGWNFMESSISVLCCLCDDIMYVTDLRSLLCVCVCVCVCVWTETLTIYRVCVFVSGKARQLMTSQPLFSQCTRTYVVKTDRRL